MDFEGWTIKDWRTWHDSLHLPPLKSSADYAEAYCSHYKPMLEENETTHAGAPSRVVLFCSQFFNRWLWVAGHKWKLSDREALEEVASALRLHEFGEKRQSLGPDPDLVQEIFKGSLSQGHLELVDERVRDGADPILLDILHGRGISIATRARAPRSCLRCSRTR